jgi:hypothetical protein
MTLEANYTGMTSLASGVTPTGVTLGYVGLQPPYGMPGRLAIYKSRVDTSLTTHTGAGDVYEAIKCPAYCHVLSAWFEVVKVESVHPTATMALGVSGDTAGFVSTAVCTALVPHAITNGGVKMLAGGFSCAGTSVSIDLISATEGFGDAIIDVYALILDMTSK